jgi:hypothetical protein
MFRCLASLHVAVSLATDALSVDLNLSAFPHRCMSLSSLPIDLIGQLQLPLPTLCNLSVSNAQLADAVANPAVWSWQLAGRWRSLGAWGILDGAPIVDLKGLYRSGHVAACRVSRRGRATRLRAQQRPDPWTPCMHHALTTLLCMHAPQLSTTEPWSTSIPRPTDDAPHTAHTLVKHSSSGYTPPPSSVNPISSASSRLGPFLSPPYHCCLP